MSIQGKVALLIDDAQDMRLLGKTILEKIGMVARLASSVTEAFESIAAQKPDVIILDLDMPDLSGFDFLTMLKTRPQFSDIPVVVSSGLNDSASIQKAIALGAKDYLVKPMRVPIMMHRMKKIFRRPDFKAYRFPEVKSPFLSAKAFDNTSNLDNQPKIGLKVAEIDEIGMMVSSRVLIAFGAEFTLSGDFLKEVTRAKNVKVTCVTVSLNPVLGSYSTYLEFDPLEEKISEDVKGWITQRSLLPR